MSSTTAPRAAPDRPPVLSLAAVLTGCALLEVLFYRVLRPLVRSEAEILPAGAVRAAEWLAGLSLNLVALLSLLVLFGVLVRLVRPGLLRSPMGHLSFGLIGGAHVLLAGLLLLGPGSLAALGVGVPRAQVMLQVSFVCLAILLVAAMLPLRAEGRLKAGAALLCLPVLLHFYTFWSVVKGAVYPAQMDALALGQVALAVAEALAVVCFCPWPPRPRQGTGVVFAAGAATLVCLTAGALCMLDSEMLARIGHAAFSVRLPLSRILQVLYLLALGSFVFATVLLLLQPSGPYRLRGFGLLLVGLGGYQVQEPHRMALVLLGLFAILRSAGPAPRRAGRRASA